MSRDALDSYVRRDIALAQQVLNQDDALDALKTQVFRELLPGAASADNLRDGKFGDELLEIGIDNVFGRLWGKK